MIGTSSPRSEDRHTGVIASELLALVVRSQGGDRVAFGELFQRRVDTVHRYIAAILRDAERAQDATAETFLAAWKSLPRLREPERFDAWLLRIAHHRAMDEFRSQRPTIALDDAPESTDERPGASPADLAERGADREVVHAALAALPEAQRDVLTLRYLHDLPHEEIARQLGRSPDAVRQLRQRGLARLRRQLDPG
jgi:RNA polymerase sigma-70 factor (ECF subfamily)